MNRTILTLSMAALLLAAAPNPALAAKGPSSAEVDDGVAALTSGQRSLMSAAADTHTVALTDQSAATFDLEVARLEEKEARAWEASVTARITALRAASAVASKQDDGAAVEALAVEAVQADQAHAWTQARVAAARKRVQYETARVAWAKVNVDHAVLGVEVARLQTFKAHVEDSPRVDLEIGKTQTRLGKTGAQEARERLKRDTQHADWREAWTLAEGLTPAVDTLSAGNRAASTSNVALVEE